METEKFIRFELSSTGNGTSHIVWGGKLIIGGLLMLLGLNVKVMQNIAKDELIESVKS
ncbi:hypothetical protein QSX02_002075 [Salmonella enterica]|nr:hypothetical protein [Salmonella enterica]ELQ3566727.1 hypothetical protein [Salmonella enterica]